GGTDAFWEVLERGDLSAFGLGGEERVDQALPVLAQWRRRQRTEALIDSWRYRIAWKPVPDNPAPALTGTWLLVVPAGHPDRDIFAAATLVLQQYGATVLTLAVDSGREETLDIADRIQDGLAGLPPAAGVLSFLSLDEQPHPMHVQLPNGLFGTLNLIQAAVETELVAPIWHVTRTAMAVRDGETPQRPQQAQTWGMARVASLELPEQWGGLIDLPADVDDTVLHRLAGALARDDDEDQLALRDTGVLASRLLPAPRDTTAPDRSWRPEGTVVVTGGTGALGSHVARWLAGLGAEHLVLVSRSGDQAPGAAELVAELSGMGSRVTVAACEVADRTAVAALVRQLAEAGDPIRAVMHTAGIGGLAPVAGTNVPEFGYIATGKVAGARHFLDLIEPEQLDIMVFFSSIAGVWGVGDHGSYAAANAYLDALAQADHNHRILSVAWGPWAAGGMVKEGTEEKLRRQGVPLLEPETALAALQRALDNGDTFVAVADVDWERFGPVFTSARNRPLIGDLPQTARAAAHEDEQPDAEPSTLRAELALLSAAERDQAVLDLVLAHSAAVLGHRSADGVEAGRAFREVGLDSVTAVELRNRLNKATGLKLPATLVFDHPSPIELAAFLTGEILPSAAEIPLPELSELEQIEAALSARAHDDIERVRTVMRLEAILSKLGRTHEQAGNGASLDIGSATNEELFDLIDKDLGLS
ncbi:SDR family NAD(P)-dependent oxidoreductase, partial [Actinoplanes sp. DH11]|uniref:SDR family NAD(P)-dependent oxidoreductase n=1 Tax=Actinoplanes sp. DH11 TaxID=2857011 RepID=UPI001E60B500